MKAFTAETARKGIKKSVYQVRLGTNRKSREILDLMV